MRDTRLFLLTAGIAVVGSNSLSLSPIAPAVAADLHGSAADVMIASAAYGVGVALSALLLAPKIDKIGADRALSIAFWILFAALGVSAAAPGIYALAAAQAIAGIAAGGALPAIYALTAQIAPKGRESETLGVVLAGWTVSMVAGVGLAGLTAEMAHWRVVYGFLSAVAGALGVVTLRARDWGASPRAERAVSPIQALQTPGIGRGLFATISYMIAFYASYSFLGAHTSDALGRGAGAAGVIALSYGVGFGAVAPLGAHIDRIGPMRVAPIAFALLVAIYAALALLAHSYWAIVALAFVWGFANHVGLNIIVGRLSALDPSRRGAIMGLYSAVVYACVFAGATGFRPVYQAFGWDTVTAIAGIAILPLAIRATLRLRPTRSA